MRDEKTDVMQGTLDLLVLKTLKAMASLPGRGIARRIEQVSEDAIRMIHGALYLALVRLEQRGWIKSQWGVSENIRCGTKPEEARYAARRSFGGIDQAKEAWRDRCRSPRVDQRVQDLRFGARSLGRSPGVVTFAVLSLGVRARCSADLREAVETAARKPMSDQVLYDGPATCATPSIGALQRLQDTPIVVC